MPAAVSAEVLSIIIEQCDWVRDVGPGRNIRKELIGKNDAWRMGGVLDFLIVSMCY